MDRMGEQATMEYNIVLKLGAFVGGFLSGFVNTRERVRGVLVVCAVQH